VDNSDAEVLRARVRDLEAQLARSQKLQAIGALAGGVAHDFNNLLTAILGHASLLREEVPPGSPLVEPIYVITRAAERAAQLTRQLLGFARGAGSAQQTRVDLYQTLAELIQLLRHTIDKSIRCELIQDAADVCVIGDSSQIFQVFLNLALNARDAMPSGGLLQFRVSKSEEWARVSVTDTGRGIPPSLTGRIFERFFTTKGPDMGTGLGLTVADGIVKGYGGQIEVESEPGRGSTFHVLLPAADPFEDSTVDLPQPVAVAGKGCVLVIDDEDMVRQVASRMLTALGYRPVCLAGSREAIEHCRAHRTEADIVLLDLVMPDMSGKECFEALQQVNPNLKVIVSSGYGRDATVEALLAAGAKAFLPKPYRPSQLSEALATALS
jgi:two-component system, cell cycle sensor histidine kinase and response regulator CckA